MTSIRSQNNSDIKHKDQSTPMINTGDGGKESPDSSAPHISMEAFAVLTSMFGVILAPTLDILDHGKVTKFVCSKSGRAFYRIKEPAQSSNNAGDRNKSNPMPITCDTTGDFCFCTFYAKQCLNERGSCSICKHVLAAKLADALSQAHPLKQILVVKEIEE